LVVAENKIPKILPSNLPNLEDIDMKIECLINLKNVKDFTDKFGASALEMQIKEGLPALAVLAQLALETGWGQYILTVIPEDSKDGMAIPSNNLFNIKKTPQWTGKSGYRSVWEDDNANGLPENTEYKKEWFKIYPDYESSFRDYAQLIKAIPRYAPALAVAYDANKYAEALQACGYATDGKYASKIKSIIKTWRIV
jgi:flagellar protein FlgJ